MCTMFPEMLIVYFTPSACRCMEIFAIVVTVSRHVSPPLGEPGHVSPAACEPGHVSPSSGTAQRLPPGPAPQAPWGRGYMTLTAHMYGIKASVDLIHKTRFLRIMS